MASKKGKKTKGKTIPLQDFLGDTPGPATPIPKIKSWADEDDDDFSYMSRPKDPVVLPTAPRAARDSSINEENIPTNPPYVAYISNLPYDVEEEDLYEFFQDMKVDSMRLPKEANKFKGYGYVEFQDRQSLIDALNMVDTNLKTRRVRIEVSNSSNDDRRGGRMGRMGDQRREYSPERTIGDWRSARAGDDGPPAGNDREDRAYRSRGFERRGDDIRGGDRDSGFEDTKPSNWRDAPRDTSFQDRPRPSYRDSRPLGGGGDDRGDRRFPDRGMRSMRDGSGERNGERGGGGFGPRRYNDDPDREKDRWSSIRSQPREPLPEDSSRPSSDVPMTRPKLELKPRTKPIEPVVTPKSDGESESQGESAEASATPAASAPAPVPSANIFGAAKPVDTAAREREIEERLAKSAEVRAKEEGDSEKRGPREGTWNRRNGDSRFEQDRSRPAWRSRPGPDSERDQRDNQDHRERRADSRGSSSGRGARPSSRGPLKHVESRPPPDGAKKEKKIESEEEELARMPKAKDDQAPNFIASNKYFMLPDDVDPDDIEEQATCKDIYISRLSL